MRQTTRRARARYPSRRKPPSRVRYEAAHPTVSCRVPRALYQRLQAAKEAEGKSFADILKVGLGVLEVKTGKEEELKKQGYREGYKKGHSEAERCYKITYPCAICGKTIAPASTEEKEAVQKYVQEHGWGHAECHSRRR